MKRILFSLMAVLFTVIAFAQEGGTDLKVDVTKTESSFPWIWVVGGLVVLVLLVVLLSGGRGGTDRVVEKRTVIKD